MTVTLPRFERRHLLLLFVAGLVTRGVVRTFLGNTASFLLLLAVALYYLHERQQSRNIYDEVARQQAEAAAKIDALHGIGDGTVSMEKFIARRTHFQLNESDRMVITDRMHQYASKMRGSHSDRKKFLRKRSKKGELGEGEETITTPPSQKSKKPGKEMEKIVEDAINETL
ncbi:hypothetical protein Poli38472_002877 [Pythium oligandrum]|uniref:Uncharacterized protein n=1 Tax=Pythium oligandrum TaxID=41045 RepID=A0A8K1C6I8_PYTOL|nr:hypothetical protein Poli38472_002877 [Pythium oligandrum]|eukprot:TMW56952.1 hypothetical protein Poli38472_002877 [Pythium oligandrum]